jgi:hypothetical protein
LNGKRYKLINFAPKSEIVDNVPTMLIISKKQLTGSVGKRMSRVENETGKKKKRKFSTYQRHIIYHHLVF